MDLENRVVVLIDMDCFYCQVEEKLNPELKGKPIAVVQYNPWKGGGIIAVNYVARAQGVTRHMRGDEAKEKCPEIFLPSVPCNRGKADISKYREAGKEVARVLQKFTNLLERASIDEAYLDITENVNERLRNTDINSITTESMPNTFALGYSNVADLMADVHSYGSDNIDFDYENAQRMLVGAVVVSEIRAAVYNVTGYRCSAGISHNKILAKLVCGMNKPNKQTLLPKHCVNILYKTLPLQKVKHLGGKFGQAVCAALQVTCMSQLQTFTEKELQDKFDEKNGTWLYNIARGTDLEPVQARFNPKSIGCCKNFKGKAALLDLESLRKWLKDLGDEIEDRLEKDALENNRTPRQMVVSYACQLADGRDSSSSRSYNFTADDDLGGELFYRRSLELVVDGAEGARVKEGDPNRKLQMPIKFLGISVGKFEDTAESKKTRKINDFFSAGSSKDKNKDKNIKKDNPNTNNEDEEDTAESKKTRKINDFFSAGSSKDTNKKDNPNKNNEDEENNMKENSNKIKPEKEFILQKFFQVTDKNKTVVKKDKKTETVTKATNEPIIESSLDKQESFFAKFLNQTNQQPKATKVEQLKVQARPNTPICKVLECGDNSRDSDYSSSTINEEINKSISLFEDEPIDVARVSRMRTLLNTTKIAEETVDEDKENSGRGPTPPTPPLALTLPEISFVCGECGKTIPLLMFDTHADFHYALKLREEERQLMRDERGKIPEKPATKVIKVEKETKNEPSTSKSITDFLVKIDETVPLQTCAECGKKVPAEMFVEHQDFHEAQKLSRELNKKPSSSFSNSSVKRKRKTTSPDNKPKMLCKPISSFFRS